MKCPCRNQTGVLFDPSIVQNRAMLQHTHADLHTLSVIAKQCLSWHCAPAMLQSKESPAQRSYVLNCTGVPIPPLYCRKYHYATEQSAAAAKLERQLRQRETAVEVWEQAVSVAEAEARAFAQGSAVATNQKEELQAARAEELRLMETALVGHV